MTRKKLVDIMKNYIGAIPMPECIFGFDKAANSILYALEKEHDGEVVVVAGLMEVSGGYSTDTNVLYCNSEYVDFTQTIDGKRGQLIFRPTKEAK